MKYAIRVTEILTRRIFYRFWNKHVSCIEVFIELDICSNRYDAIIGPVCGAHITFGKIVSDPHFSLGGKNAHIYYCDHCDSP
mgnify:CR=1 FL=1